MSAEKYYAMRITTHDEPLVQTLLSTYSHKWLYAIEVGTRTEKVHFHIYMETTHKSPAIRSWIRKYVGSGNGNYTMKETEKYPLEYLSYIIKDDKFHTSDNYTQQEIDEIIEYDRKVKREISERNEKKKNKKSYIVKYVEKNLPQSYLINEKTRGSLPDFDSLRKETMLVLIKYCREEDCYPSITRIRSESLYVIQKLFGDQYDRKILELCL